MIRGSLNQNNAHLQEQAEFVAVQNRIGTIRTVAENPDLARVVYELGPDESLDEMRKKEFLNSVFVHWQWQFERTRAGLIEEFDSDEHMAFGFRRALLRWKTIDAWHELKNIHAADFREFMDTQVIGNPG